KAGENGLATGGGGLASASVSTAKAGPQSAASTRAAADATRVRMLPIPIPLHDRPDAGPAHTQYAREPVAAGQACAVVAATAPSVMREYVPTRCAHAQAA